MGNIINAAGIRPRNRRVSSSNAPPAGLLMRRKSSLQQIDEVPTFVRPRRRAAALNISEGSVEEGGGGELSRAEMYERMMMNDDFEVYSHFSC